MNVKAYINRILLIAIVVVGYLCFVACSSRPDTESENPELESLLCRLDSLIDISSEFTELKEDRIAKLRSSFETNKSTERQYWIASDLYDEYRAYNPDSAHAWIDRSIAIAKNLNRPDLVRDMELNAIYLYSATGMLDEADSRISRFDINSASDVQALKYCERMIYLENHRSQYLGKKNDRLVQKADSLLKELMPNITTDNPDYCWMQGWFYERTGGNPEEIIPTIDSIVSNERPDSHIYARDAWMLARLYQHAGDEVNSLKYTTLSAMADVRSSNKEIASLEQLGGWLLDEGDVGRANKYIGMSMQCANEYGSRVRLAKLARLQEKTLTRIHSQLEEQVTANQVFIVVLGVLIIILGVGVFYIVRRNRLLSISREDLDKANKALNSQIQELKLMHRKLNESKAELSEAYEKLRNSAKDLADVNVAKEESIAKIFGLCSSYITKLEGFRTNILALLKDKRFDEAMRIVRSPELSYDEVKELYANFDKVFLEIYPDFVDDFNTLLRPEDRIELKNPTQLTTELRIYALVRLGLNDSVKIARFLHCSVQTVYNARQRTRNKSEVDKNEFAARVQALGRLSF